MRSEVFRLEITKSRFTNRSLRGEVILQINQRAIDRVINHLNERKRLLEQMKGESVSIEMLKLEIATIEATLISLEIGFEKTK